MEKIDILLWVMGGGFAIIFTFLILIYKELKENRKDLHEIDKRLYGIETVLHMKDCCILKQDQSLKKVE